MDTPKSYKEINESLKIIIKMAQDNSISKHIYYLSLMEIALDYAEIDYIQSAITTLSFVPESFLEEELPVDMEIEEINEITRSLHRRFQLAGIIGEHPTPTQAKAEA